MYANRQHSPMTIRSVNVIVATHSEAATGALAVKSICLIINVFSYSQYLPTSIGNKSPQTVKFALNFTYFNNEDELK